jgi:hypothetical protein
MPEATLIATVAIRYRWWVRPMLHAARTAHRLGARALGDRLAALLLRGVSVDVVRADAVRAERK